MSELVVANPSSTELDVIIRQADALARSSIVPGDYRGKPANIIAAALMGRSFGWDATTSMRMITVISGTAGLKPEAMLALIRKRGHHVSIEAHPDGRGVTVTGRRADNGDTASASFTLEDAERAGLTRSSAWRSYPVDMCQWRAVARLSRSLFGDVVLGAGYTAEELGGDRAVPVEVIAEPVLEAEPVDAEVIDVEVFETDTLDELSTFAELIAGCPDITRLRELWREADAAGYLTDLEDALRDRAAELTVEVTS